VDTLTLIVAIGATLAAIWFTIVPIIPGSLLIPVAAIAIGFMSSFDVFSWPFWVGQALLVAAAFVIDNLAQLAGVRVVGGSRSSMIGSGIGVLVGPFAMAPLLGIVGLIIGPIVGAAVGAVAGEVHWRRKHGHDQPSVGHAARISGVVIITYVVSLMARLTLVVVQAAWLVIVMR
jgi:uncharacterized protein YqgC (DUF456 family)